MYTFKGSKKTIYIYPTMLAIASKAQLNNFVSGSKYRVSIRLCYFLRPLHAAFISKSCLHHALCIVY